MGYENYVSEDDATCQRQWQILCAKQGITDAAQIVGNGGSIPGEVHEARKVMRRAINSIKEKLGPRDYTDDVTNALMHAGKVIAGLSNRIDRMEAPPPRHHAQALHRRWLERAAQLRGLRPALPDR